MLHVDEIAVAAGESMALLPPRSQRCTPAA
jgi:hypothetical protein